MGTQMGLEAGTLYISKRGFNTKEITNGYRPWFAIDIGG
jgi:hypothetical protein